MADLDIQQALDIIDRKIRALQAARHELAVVFGISDAPSPVVPQAHPASPTVPKPIPKSVPLPKPRKEALAEFLIKNGPMPRADIVNNAGLPEGTVSYCLADKRFFEQLENGDWNATEFSRRGFEKKSQSNGHGATPT